MKKVEIYKWCPKDQSVCFGNNNLCVVIGMLKAKRLAVKGLGVSV